MKVKNTLFFILKHVKDFEKDKKCLAHNIYTPQKDLPSTSFFLSPSSAIVVCWGVDSVSH